MHSSEAACGVCSRTLGVVAHKSNLQCKQFFGYRSTTVPNCVKLLFRIKYMATKWQVWATNSWWSSTIRIGMRSTEVQQGVRDCFIVKLIPDPYSKWGWNHPWHPLLPTHSNYFRICLVIHAENPTQNEWDVSFMQLLVKALQGVKSRLDLNWSQQYRIRSSRD